MRNRKRLRTVLKAISVPLLCTLLLSLWAGAWDEGEKVRVGLPVQYGFVEVDEKGEISGYTYEYLQEVAQYTGWEYEFVVMEGDPNDTIGDAVEMLAAGKLDLMGAMNYSPALAELYSYPSESCGIAYSTLAVLDSNTAITEGNYAMKEHLRIAVNERSVSRNEQLMRFCESSHIDAEYLYCADGLEQLELLRSGEADAVLWNDLSLEDDLRQVARFAPTSFYFAATKGSTELVSQLNRALTEISKADPYFEVTLHEKYFGHRKSGLQLTHEEQVYIEGMDTLRVAVMPEKAPIQDIDATTGEFVGVAREVFDYISEQTGLHFEFVNVGSAEELEGLLKESAVDLAACIPYDYEAAERYGVALGRPYLVSQEVMVLGSSVDAGNLEGKRLALTKSAIYSGGFMGEVTWYDTLEECIRAVDAGQADYSYGNGFSVQYYSDRNHYRNITLVPQSAIMEELCIGMAKPVDGTLLTILNKVVLSIPTAELQAMIYRNAVPDGQITLANFVESNPLETVMGIAAAAALIVGAIVVYYKAKMRFSRRMAVENERYLQLCELSNEHIYEYDYEKDCLTLSEKSARALGVPQIQEKYRLRLWEDQSDDGGQLRQLFLRIQERRGDSDDTQCLLPDGSRRWFRVTGKLISDKEGKPVLSIGKLTDIQQEKEERERLVDRAQRDSLTKLYNAAAIRQLVSERLTECKGRGALIIIDIDHFKQINDQFGHYEGDQVLIALARLLEDVFRRDDIVGRLGGDEFVVFMDKVDSCEAVASKCGRLVREVGKLSGLPKGLKLTLSVGCTMAVEGGDYNQLYQQADKGLYTVKRRGRNGFEIQ